MVKKSSCNVGDLGLIPGLGRSPGERNSNPLQYSCLENSTHRGAWLAPVHGVTESDTTEQLTLTGSGISPCCPKGLFREPAKGTVEPKSTLWIEGFIAFASKHQSMESHKSDSIITGVLFRCLLTNTFHWGMGEMPQHGACQGLLKLFCFCIIHR